MTQLEKIYRHLQDKGSITTWEAIQQYGITRLSAHIHTLRQKYNIQDEIVVTKNAYNEKIHYKRYFI